MEFLLEGTPKGGHFEEVFGIGRGKGAYVVEVHCT